jgi:hypothetical protein
MGPLPQMVASRASTVSRNSDKSGLRADPMRLESNSCSLSELLCLAGNGTKPKLRPYMGEIGRAKKTAPGRHVAASRSAAARRSVAPNLPTYSGVTSACEADFCYCPRERYTAAATVPE